MNTTLPAASSVFAVLSHRLRSAIVCRLDALLRIAGYGPIPVSERAGLSRRQIRALRHSVPTVVWHRHSALLVARRGERCEATRKLP